MIIGDDLTVTNHERLSKAIKEKDVIRTYRDGLLKVIVPKA